MADLFDIIHDYRMLREKRDQLHIPLDTAEQAELAGLERFLSGEVPAEDSQRALPRLPSPLTLQFTAPGGFEVGEIRNVSGGGMAIQTVRPLERGARTILRLVNSDRGVEYLFPARVVWRAVGVRREMGLAFDGVPTRSVPYPLPEGVWKRRLAFSRTRPTTILA